MKKKLIVIFSSLFFVAIVGSTIKITSSSSGVRELVTLNTQAHAQTGAGSCPGQGPGGSGLTCHGGPKQCCMHHGKIYGKPLPPPPPASSEPEEVGPPA